MTMYGSHQGIAYVLEEKRSGEWTWSFQPPDRPKRRSGVVRGEYKFAVAVVQRGIEVWNLMNKPRSVAA